MKRRTYGKSDMFTRDICFCSLPICNIFVLFFFFFQAEDGIRDLIVTGVQTCALPIFTELRKLERIRRDFVANVSHEFKTPLTAIQGFAETLLAGAIDDPQNRIRFLEIILEHSRRLARLTDDLLKLSKMDADKLELEIRRMSVSVFVEGCIETTQ